MATPMGTGIVYCAECGRPTGPEELVRFGDRLICSTCKDIYAQKLREGAPPAAAGFVFAGFWIRFVAYLIDAIILMVVGSTVQFAVFGNLFTGFQPPQPGARPEDVFASFVPLFAAIAQASALSYAIHATYESLFIWKFAATPGKMAIGLQVLRPNGERLTLGRSIGRFFAKILSGLILAIGYIIAGFDAEKKALHDMICDTRVIQARRF